MEFIATAKWQGVHLHEWRCDSGLIEEKAYESHQLNLGLSGRMDTMRQTASGRQLRMKSDELCLVPQGQPIGAEVSETVDCVSLMIRPDFLTEAAHAAGRNGPVELIEVATFQDPLLRHIGLALRAEARQTAPQDSFYAENLTHTLALHLLKHYAVNPVSATPRNGGLPGYKLRRVQEFIRAKLGEELSLNTLAAVAGLSPFHFNRSFKRATGQTPQHYLTHCRIERAKELLVKDSLSLVDVAASVGFKNQSHFTSVFHRFTGATPKSWRNLRGAV